MTTTEQTAPPVPARRVDRDRLRRGDVVVQQFKDYWLAEKVVKVDNTTSQQQLWLVAEHIAPFAGKNGSASIHYPPHSGYRSTALESLRRNGFWLLDDILTSRTQEWVASLGREAGQRARSRAAGAEARRISPDGIVERLKRRAADLEWRAKSLRTDATALDALREELLEEIELIKALRPRED